jgi:hypothetical protein
MAIGKRRTRPLSLGGQHFRWRCDFSLPVEMASAAYATEGASWQTDTLIVRPVDGPHRLLTVTWPACNGPLVTPGLVRACVEEALRRGWLTTLPSLELAGTDVRNGEEGSE